MEIDARAAGRELSGIPRRRKRAVGWALGALGASLAALGAGFLWFAITMPRPLAGRGPSADAIVVLTGGPARVFHAIDLLADARGARLLISGVGGSAGAADLARWRPGHQRLFACCIDIDHAARNTVENAVETRRWVDRHGFRSLVVVTSSYHMRRAMAELAHRLPDVALIAYPVITERWSDPWWGNRHNLEVVVIEYLKYLAVRARIALAPAVASSGRVS